MLFFIIPGSLDLSQGNKEAQQTTSAICLLSWPQISLPPPSSALSPKWWSGETPSSQTAVANLRSSFFVDVFFLPGHDGVLFSVSRWFVSVSLFFSLPCWFVLVFIWKSLFEGFGVDPNWFLRMCGVELWMWQTWRPLKGESSQGNLFWKNSTRRKCSLKTKGKMLSSVEEHVRTRMFQGFLLSFLLIDLPKVVAIQVQIWCSY